MSLRGLYWNTADPYLYIRTHNVNGREVLLIGGNVYLAAGDSGQGMTHGTVAGILLTALIHGRESP